MSNEAQVQDAILQSQQQDAGKEARKFEANRKKLIAILNGDAPLKKGAKVPKDDITKAMEELLKEKKADVLTEIKAGTKSLIEEYIAFDEFQKAKKKELEKAIGEKHKDFNKKAEALFNKMGGLDELERTYYAALVGASTPAPAQEPPMED